jgi:hypothetical protein
VRSTPKIIEKRPHQAASTLDFLLAEFIVGGRPDPCIHFDFRISRNLRSRDAFGFYLGALPTPPTATGLLARERTLMAAPMSTNARSTVATTPVVTPFDVFDWVTPMVIYSPSITIHHIRVGDSAH